MNLVQVLLIENQFLRDELRKRSLENESEKNVVLLSPSLTACEVEELRSRRVEEVREVSNSRRVEGTDGNGNFVVDRTVLTSIETPTA